MLRIFKSIIFSYLFLALSCFAAKYGNIHFEHLSTEQGLSQSSVECFLRDSKGFMWIGTQGGLNRYDGYKFKIYKPEVNNPKSLSHVFVTNIIEMQTDTGRVLWVGTEGGGLNRFDVDLEQFEHYRYESNNPNCISNDRVSGIIADKDGALWIGTFGGGLNKFIPHNKQFKTYRHDPNDPNSLCSDDIKSILLDDMDLIWIGTEGGGLSCFNPKTERFVNFQNDPDDRTSLSNNYIYGICRDRKNNLWIGTKYGLNKMNLSSFNPEVRDSRKSLHNFTRYFHNQDDPGSLSGNWILTIIEDHHGNLWLANYGGGLNLYDYDQDIFIHYRNDPANPASLSSNSLRPIYDDQEGEALWVGTDGKGINKFTKRMKNILHHKNDPDDPFSINPDPLYALTEDQRGNIWIGTQTQGLDCFDPSTNKFYHYHRDSSDPNSLLDNKIYTIISDRQGRLWIGTAHGLARYDYSKGNFINYLHNPEDLYGLKSSWIMAICQDPIDDEIFWIGTDGGGLAKFNSKEEIFFHYTYDKNNPNSLNNNVVMSLYVDIDNSNPTLWIGTDGGLNKLDILNEKFTHYKNDPQDPQSLSNNHIISLYQDISGMLWVGTWGGGLNRFDKKKEIFKRYTEKDGLPNESILGFLEDDHGNLWICTMYGISKFNPKTEKFYNIDVRDGLQSNEFWRGCCKTQDGMMYFGGTNGLDVFHPDSIKINQHIPNIVLTDFQIFNKSLKPGRYSPLTKSVSEIYEIILPYNLDIFSFEFSALDFTIPDKNQYTYKMEGVNPDWVVTDATQRIATYTKLDPGEYLFHVKGSNNDGVWNEIGTSVKVVILPPWWRTNLAYIFYVLLILTVISTTWYLQLRRIRIKHELEIEHVRAEKLEEVDRLKSHFFANISHEFRTPLTLIEGPAKQLLRGELKDNLKESYQMIVSNAERLLNLVNQLLDLSKLDSGKMRFRARKTNIIPLLKGLVKSFASLAERKKINLKYNSSTVPIYLYTDEEKFEKIINNLLSNAFKFTPEGGEVEVRISKGDAFSGKILNNPNSIGRNASPQHSQSPVPNSNFVKITISNTGSVIPADKVDKIFDRFYQVDDSKTRHFEGTGIGLALTKELVELHHGEIKATSEAIGTHDQSKHLSESPSSMRGSPKLISVDLFSTTFTVLLPLGKEHLNKNEILETQNVRTKHHEKEVELKISNIVTDASPQRHLSSQSPVSGLRSPTILIVEDHQEVRFYISNILGDSYRFLHAADGKKGLTIAKNKKVDLIISDVMMPEMDGYVFCKKIKMDQRTCHIPVILLTARVAQEDRIEGLETGADDYITKPFDSEELRIRVINLLQLRCKLHQRFANEMNVQPKEITVTSSDEKFLSRLIDMVEREMSNSELSVSYFANEIGMSYIQLYRKIEVIAGVSPTIFIRMLRIKRANQLLKQNFGNVSEIAFEVGFNSVSYFSSCFSQHFGHPPSSILKENNSNTS